MIELTSSANSKSPSNFRLHLASLTRTSSTVATNIQENRMALDPAGEHRPPWTNETRRRRANSRKTRAPSNDSTTKNNGICPRNDDRKTMLKRRARKLQHVLCYPCIPLSGSVQFDGRTSCDCASWVETTPHYHRRVVAYWSDSGECRRGTLGATGGYLYKRDYPSHSVPFPRATVQLRLPQRVSGSKIRASAWYTAPVNTSTCSLGSPSRYRQWVDKRKKGRGEFGRRAPRKNPVPIQHRILVQTDLARFSFLFFLSSYVLSSRTSIRLGTLWWVILN